MSDPFNVNRLDSLSGTGDAGTGGPTAPPVSQLAARARLMEGFGGDNDSPQSVDSTPTVGGDSSDFGHAGDVGDTSSARGTEMAGHLLAAWGSPDVDAGASKPASATWGLTQQSGPQPGFQPGFTMGSNGVSGLDPGMQSGAVYASPILRL